MIKVLFVCLGNICRSPMAEGIFNKLILDNGLINNVICDSAGTSNYHTGELPDIRMCQTAQKHGISITHLARQIKQQDFEEFDYIMAMDESNYLNITKHPAWDNRWKNKLILMRSHDEEITDLNVPDPYFGELDGFEEVYELLLKNNTRFISYLIEKHHLDKHTV
jgi:protein-tyrosine phosphatase